MKPPASGLPDPMEAPSASVRRFELQGGLLLLDKSSNTLFAYNEVALSVWNSIEAGKAAPEIGAALAAQWGIPASVAQNDVDAIVALWRAQGLLAGDGATPAPSPIGHAGAAIASAFDPPAEWICTIRGTAIAFTIAPEVLTPVRALFSHLETPDAAPQCRVTMSATSSGDFALLVDGRERLSTDDPALAIGALFVAVIERIRPETQWFALLHGAALARNGHGFALAGMPGAGKSTLAAGLIAAGFDYLADDLVALSSPDAAIVPWPLPLSVKPGSLDILMPRLPQLASAPRYQTKGFEARLLVPPGDVWNAEPAKLRTLLFPRFAQDAAPQTHRLSTFEALERLLTDRVWLGDPITEERVTAFLAWLDDTPAYVLSYGTLDDAVRLVGGVIP